MNDDQNNFEGLEIPPSTVFDEWWNDHLIIEEEADLVLEDDYDDEDE